MHRLLWLTALSAIAGCTRAPAPEKSPSPHTGAEEVATAFFTALINQDWDEAHKTLNAETQARIPPTQFAKLAETYCENLAFRPSAMQLRSCDERDSEAIAHVSLKGTQGETPRFARDSIGLHFRDGRWSIELPPHFGQKVSKH